MINDKEKGSWNQIKEPMSGGGKMVKQTGMVNLYQRIIIKYFSHKNGEVPSHGQYLLLFGGLLGFISEW